MEEIKGQDFERKIRIEQGLYSIDKYYLRIKPFPECDIFEGHVTIDISIKDQDISQIYLHMENLTISKF